MDTRVDDAVSGNVNSRFAEFVLNAYRDIVFCFGAVEVLAEDFGLAERVFNAERSCFCKIEILSA